RGLSLLLDLIGLAALPRILRRGLALLGPGVFLLLADLRLGRRRRRTPDQGDPVLVVGERIPRAPLHGGRALDGGDEGAEERHAAQQHGEEAQRLPPVREQTPPACG